jgi:hypothetical protein
MYEDGDDVMLTQHCCRRTEAAEQLPKHHRVQRPGPRGGDPDPRACEYGVHISISGTYSALHNDGADPTSVRSAYVLLYSSSGVRSGWHFYQSKCVIRAILSPAGIRIAYILLYSRSDCWSEGGEGSRKAL